MIERDDEIPGRVLDAPPQRTDDPEIFRAAETADTRVGHKPIKQRRHILRNGAAFDDHPFRNGIILIEQRRGGLFKDRHRRALEDACHH